jgi:methionyl-tRNA formyltransferase
VKVLALENNLPILQPTSLRKQLPEVLEQLSALGPFDVGVVIAFGQILPREILEIPRCGCINIHASLLPRWRGAAPIQRAIAAGDKETGVCLMQMDTGLDTGAVFCEKRLLIRPNDTAGSLHDALAALGASLLVSELEGIVSGSLRASPQPLDGVTYAAKISSEECRIDWNKTSDELALVVRALSPSPAAFSLWRGKRLKIISAHSTPSTTVATAGTIVQASNGKLEVGCSSGTLVIDELQLEGKKRMTTEEFLRGTGLTEGEILGG